jgi:hypothetical protein
MKVKDVVRTTTDREHGDLLPAGLMILKTVIQTPSFFLFKKYNNMTLNELLLSNVWYEGTGLD